MPYSDDSNDDEIIKYLIKTMPDKVLDVGAGAGKYGKMLKSFGGLYNPIVDAVEVWTPYVDQFGLRDLYDTVYVEDIRQFTPDDFEEYDLVIFGDVLEHMSKEDAVAVWNKVNKGALISIPIIHYPQGHYEGNPYEEHVKDDWSVEEVLDTFDVTLLAKSAITAVFVR